MNNMLNRRNINNIKVPQNVHCLALSKNVVVDDDDDDDDNNNNNATVIIR
jgi:hypothetical protein